LFVLLIIGGIVDHHCLNVLLIRIIKSVDIYLHVTKTYFLNQAIFIYNIKL